jgi:hypothetical protein
MRITVDPSADAGGFGYVEPGKYTLRVKKGEQMSGTKAPYLRWEFEYADPNVQSVPVDGKVLKVGNIFENTTLSTANNGQFRLRQLCDALGVVWGDFDTDDLIGKEFEAQVDVKEYQGTLSNEVKKYIPRG